MVEKGGMHGLSDMIITAKRKRNITDSSADIGVRKILSNPFCCFKKIKRIGAVFFHACTHWKNIGVKNDILRWKTNSINEQVIGAFANFNSAIKGIGLTRFIKSHDNYCCSVTFDGFCLLDKHLFPFF